MDGHSSIDQELGIRNSFILPDSTYRLDNFDIVVAK